MKPLMEMPLENDREDRGCFSPLSPSTSYQRFPSANLAESNRLGRLEHVDLSDAKQSRQTGTLVTWGKSLSLSVLVSSLVT